MTDAISRAGAVAGVAATCICAAAMVHAQIASPLELRPDYSAMFHLDATDPGVVLSDPDNDTLLTIEEQWKNTDPTAADTDLDGLSDAEDPAPVDRLIIDWGDMDLTRGDVYEYVAPAWFVSAFKRGGTWVDNPTGWQPAADDPLSTCLCIDVDRAELPSNLVAIVEFTAPSPASLSLSLVNADEIPLAELVPTTRHLAEPDLCQARATLPFAAYPAAIGLRISSSPAVTVLNTIVYPIDTPAPDEDATTPLGHTEAMASLRADALSTLTPGADAPETMNAGTGQAAVPASPSGAGHGIIYVDAATGNDGCAGTRAVRGSENGPKRTIPAGFAAVAPGGTVSVAAGDYTGKVVVPPNVKLVTRGRVVIH